MAGPSGGLFPRPVPRQSYNRDAALQLVLTPSPGDHESWPDARPAAPEGARDDDPNDYPGGVRFDGRVCES